jgi:hypothetical protein
MDVHFVAGITHTAVGISKAETCAPACGFSTRGVHCKQSNRCSSINGVQGLGAQLPRPQLLLVVVVVVVVVMVLSMWQRACRSRKGCCRVSCRMRQRGKEGSPERRL